MQELTSEQEAALDAVKAALDRLPPGGVGLLGLDVVCGRRDELVLACDGLSSVAEGNCFLAEVAATGRAMAKLASPFAIEDAVIRMRRDHFAARGRL